MAQAHQRAQADLEKALVLHPNLVFGRLIWIGMANSMPNGQLKHWLDQAMAISPRRWPL